MASHQSVLIIGKVWPEPKSSAAGIRMMQLIQLFKEAGLKVVFASTASHTGYQENLELQDVLAYSIELNSPTFDHFSQEINPTIVVFDRFMTEEQFGWRVMEHCPNALRILNAEDLHFLRYARQEALKTHQDELEEALNSEMTFREVASVYRVDVTLLVSEYEIKLLNEKFKVPHEKLHYLPLFAERIKQDLLPAFEDRKDFVFIGNFLHAPNVDALSYLCDEIWPLIRNQLPEVNLQVFGAYPTARVTKCNDPRQGILVNGRVEDAAIINLNARVNLAPLRFGAGIKGKLLEAMVCGTPSVTTEVGAESMQHNGLWNGAISDNPITFAEEAIALYTNEQKWSQAQEHGFDILAKRYAVDRFKDSFRDELSSRLENLGNTRSADFLSRLIQHHSLLSTKYLSRWIEEKNKKS